MQSTFSKFGCKSCGRITRIRWLPLVDVYKGRTSFTPDELKELRKQMPQRVNKSIPCHYCKAVVHVEPDESREFVDVTR